MQMARLYRKGEGTRPWRVAVNILNKQSRTADKLVTKILKKPWTWMSSLDKRPKGKVVPVLN
jgi:hypothetical protein